MHSQLFFSIDPILLNTGIEISCSAWSENGSLLVIAGSHRDHVSTGLNKVTEREVNIVQFYSALGDHLRSLYVPGKCLTACAWEGNGSLRLAMAVDSFIYFANLRPNYRWAYCDKANTIVYSYTRAGSPETFVVFWDTKRQQTRIRTVNHLTHICAAEDLACLACKNEDASGTCTLTLYNALGVSIGSKRIQMEPIHVVMTRNQVLAVSKDLIYAWQFFNPKNLVGMRSSLTPISSSHHDGSERLCHIDHASGADETFGGHVSSKGNVNWDLPNQAPTNDPISAIAIGGRRQLFVARTSGQVKQYRLPDLWLEGTIKTTDTKPYRIQVNCDSSLLAVIDDSGLFTLYAVKGDNGDCAALDRKQLATILRKDVWDIIFAEDNPQMFAIMEKTRMSIFDGLQPEPPIHTSAFLCRFNELEVFGVLLDELVALADQPSSDCLLRLPVKVLRDCETIFDQEGAAKALEFIEANPHPRLKRLLSERSLEQQNFELAELGFVQCQNYAGIQFVKRLRNIPSKVIRKAEIKSFFGQVDDAEQILLTSDRSDLAIELRRRLGDWFRVAQLVKDSGALVKDADLAEIWNSTGDYFADQLSWDKAAGYYRQGGDLAKFFECLYQLEDYSGLERLIEELPDGHTLLPEIASRFASIGLAQQAVYALVKCNQFREAINVCVELNQWNMALELIGQQTGTSSHSMDLQKQQYHELDRLLQQSASALVRQGRRIQAVELYKRAGRILMAAQLMFQEAQLATRHKTASPLQLKKMYVIIGLLMEQYYEQTKLQASAKTKTESCTGGVLQASSALAGLLLEEQERTAKHTQPEDCNQNEQQKGRQIGDWKKDTLWDEKLSKARRVAPNRSTPSEISDASEAAGRSSDDVIAQIGNSREFSRLIDQPWRGAEAYHFLLLAQRQLYAGNTDRALRTAQLLRDYEDILDPRITYSLIALCACLTKAFATCSKAFIKLENLPDISSEEQSAFEKLAVEIFTKYQPTNEQRKGDSAEMDSMLESESKIPICVVTGQPVTDYQFWMCPTCRHSAYEQEIARLHNCPLCHFPVQ
ncbi:WD repeat-containing protein 35 [Fasciolopsis buskii]|uniref:WD repeat-containing protein 35 n=1 Tax=Fasciolopsis buskii TaxID=27845 RepID=A0A8E0VHC3_9TREM|nr:WD repeat-containing protein 35 [Fasciolopsis buski]